MPQHTQFLLMNTSRSGDFYAEYTGVTIEALLEDAGMMDSATGILVYAPDGWSNYHPIDPEPDPELYHVKGTYPEASFHYHEQADEEFGGWCDYSAPLCDVYTNSDPIFVQGGLKMILAIRREGAYLDPGILTQENKLDGEGPFRLVLPKRHHHPRISLLTQAIRSLSGPMCMNGIIMPERQHVPSLSSRFCPCLKGPRI
ncbi:MAG: hypothetical protein ACMUIU_08805 [bacterium]